MLITPRITSSGSSYSQQLSVDVGQDETRRATPRVQGGEPAPTGRFPYMCSIRERGTGGHVCGGTLIDKNWIMTAAHCLHPDSPQSAGMSPFVYCNIYEREEQDASKRFTASRCYLHHLWDGRVKRGNDIALCQLERSTSLVFPDLSNIGDDFTKNDLFSVLGWGQTSQRGDLAEVLQIGSSLRFVLHSICNDAEIWNYQITDSMMCAGRGTPDTCKGDSGGPLFVPHIPTDGLEKGDPSLDLIVGITSFGLPDCEAEAPSVYTRVSCYRPWIDCIMEGTRQDCRVYNPCGEGSSLCSGVAKNATFDEIDALQRIRRAISFDDSETVKKILCDGLSPSAIFVNDSDSLLIAAAQYNAIESAKVLLQHGANLEYKNNAGQSALSRAAGWGAVSVVRLLINNEANIESRCVYGGTPLGYAAFYGHLRVVEILAQNGADIDCKANVGHTPLHFAAERNHLAVARFLLRNGASIESKTDVGFTPLHIATSFNSTDVAKFLLENRADVDSQTDDGFSPLHLAIASKSIEIANFLLKNQANIETKTNMGFTPLHAAAEYNFVEMAKELIAVGANIQAKTNIGYSPLHIASYNGALDVLHFLMDEKAIVDSKANDRSTPLYLASSRGHVSVVRSLLRNGASKTMTDDEGRTPFDVICTDEYLEEPCESDDKVALQELLRP